MENKYVCGLCGKTVYGLDEYLKHVENCCAKMKEEENKKAEEERLKKLNDDLNKVKEAQKYFKDKLNEFKNNYPEEYKLNFGTDETEEKVSHKSSNKSDDTSKFYGYTYHKNKDGKEVEKEFDNINEFKKAYDELSYLTKLFNI